MAGTIKRKFSLGISPCPNDTFMFDALTNRRIDTEDLAFEVHHEDVETLNRLALEGRFDITKISFALYPAIRKNYQLLTSGSALGLGVGPLLVSKRKMSDPKREIKTLAFPGEHTTAFLLFRKFFSGEYELKEMVFSEIEQAVLDGRADAGVIIHESRFTYESKGLKKIADLGSLWEESTGMPVPLGGIAVKRSLGGNTITMINSLVGKSVEFAMNHPNESRDYVKEHAQEMSDDVIDQHIGLYVNEHSLRLTGDARLAILQLINESSSTEQANPAFADEA